MRISLAGVVATSAMAGLPGVSQAATPAGAPAAGSVPLGGAAATGSPATLVRGRVIPPPEGSPVARFVNKYRPIRGFSYQPSPSNCKRWNPRTSPGDSPWCFDSDFFNEDFRQLWGPDGRDDLRTMSSIGANFLHLYNWNPYRDHKGFLDYAGRLGLGVTIPISNFTNCLIVANPCRGGDVQHPGSYAKAFENIERIFKEIYLPGADHKPHPAAAIWGVYNEYDLNGISPSSALFVIAAIVDLERRYEVPLEFRLPIFVSTSADGATNGAGPTREIARVLEESAKSDAPRTWVGEDGEAVTLGPIPDGFWQNRYIASTNPFMDAIALNNVVNEIWPAAFPGGDRWSDLPSMFFGEMGFEYPISNQGKRVRDQLQCTIPMARNEASPGGYFLGATMFEFSEEEANKSGEWGSWVFKDPPQGELVTYEGYGSGAGWIPGGTFRVDELKPRPTWEAIEAGFHAREQDCTGT